MLRPSGQGRVGGGIAGSLLSMSGCSPTIIGRTWTNAAVSLSDYPIDPGQGDRAWIINGSAAADCAGVGIQFNLPRGTVDLVLSWPSGRPSCPCWAASAALTLGCVAVALITC